MLRLGCYFEANSFVVEHEGWTDVIDQAHLSFLKPGTDLPVGLLKNQVQKWSLLVPVQDFVAGAYHRC